jgi:hypothetical protein
MLSGRNIDREVIEDETTPFEDPLVYPVYIYIDSLTVSSYSDSNLL